MIIQISIIEFTLFVFRRGIRLTAHSFTSFGWSETYPSPVTPSPLLRKLSKVVFLRGSSRIRGFTHTHGSYTETSTLETWIFDLVMESLTNGAWIRGMVTTWTLNQETGAEWSNVSHGGFFRREAVMKDSRHFVVLIRESSWVSLGRSYSWCLKLSAMFALQRIDWFLLRPHQFLKKWGSQAVNFYGFRVLWGVELSWKLEGSMIAE